MAIMLLLRHGRTTANADGLLAGWTPGIALDDAGKEQAARVAARLADTPVVAVLSSPLERCVQTATVAVSQIAEQPTLRTEEALGECRYGAWTGRRLKDLAQEPLWKDVQSAPSTVRFPDGNDFSGESMADMQQRAVAAVRSFDAQIEANHGPGALWLACSHGDVIKAILADAAGTPFDRFQRMVADPASLSVVRYTREQPFLLRTNDTGSDPVDYSALAKAAHSAESQQSPVGGGAGTV
ncbi:MAG: MSMEG_4193 family putative phosphomutase [Ornithinimicrobium sp.]